MVAAAGCGAGGLPARGDVSTGRELFVERCGSCHALSDAGTSGTIGPNLDDAFRPGREQGFAESTIAAIVADQIRYPGRGKLTESGAVMPADLVTGDDVDAVAGYVASVAGTETQEGGGGRITATSGREIYAAAGCGSCHTLAAAGSTGTIGPNLDEAQPSRSLAIDRVTNGQGAMPSFRDRLDERQIAAVADYVSTSARSR